MGFLSWLQPTRAQAVVDVGVGTAATSEGTLRELDPVAAAAFGINTESGPVTRGQAMSVPAVRRARSLIAGTIGTLPLVAYRTASDGSVTQIQRKLLQQLDPSTTPAYVLTHTVDDLMFYGISWWRVLDRDGSTGYPSAVERVRRERLAVDTRTRRVWIDGQLVDDRDLIRFDGPDEGILGGSPQVGGRTIRLALALSTAGQRAADDDWSGIVLRLADGANELTADQIDALLDEWEAARRRRSTPYLNRAVDPQSVGYDAQSRQLTELSSMVSSELARLCNLPASRIGAPQGSGMTYANTEADRRDLVDTTLAQYLAPLWQRLSMPDVTPNGQAVAVDLTAYLRGTTQELVTAGVQAIDAGLASREEVRTRWLGLPPLAGTTTREGTA